VLKDVQERIKQQREHQPPAIVVEALAAVAKALRPELRRLEASIASKNKANPALARKGELIDSHRQRAWARRPHRRRRHRLAARTRAHPPRGRLGPRRRRALRRRQRPG
jgi:hypothetical protein